MFAFLRHILEVESVFGIGARTDLAVIHYMKILYICADVGICVDRPMGAGSHIRETIVGLEKLGHEVNMLAADCSQEAEIDLSCSLPGARVVRHSWFPGIVSIKNRYGKEQNLSQATTQPPETASFVSSDTAISETPSSIKKSVIRKSTGISRSQVPETTLLSQFREQTSGFIYGTFRQHLNRIEERTVYRKRFTQHFLKLVEQFQPDAVYERYALQHHSTAAICNRRNIPHVLEVNALLAEEALNQGQLYSWERKHVQDKERHFLQYEARRVMVVSEQLKARIGEQFDHIAVNPNGVDVDIFSPTIDPEPVLRQYHLEDAFVLGWVGSFGPDRGLEEFLDIAAHIHIRRPDIRFLLVGDGGIKKQICQKLENDNLTEAVILTGRVPKQKIPAYIAAMNIALAPYPAKGAEYFSPLKVFEYMAMGRATAATAIGQCVDLLGNGAGLLLPPAQPEIWAKEIIALSYDKERCLEMGKLARHKVASQYTWQHNTERILEYIHMAIADCKSHVRT